MKKFIASFEMEIDVEFAEPEKALRYFKESDWKNYFYTFGELADAVAHLASVLDATPQTWDKDRRSFCRDIEGFGRFMERNDVFTLLDAHAVETGGVVIRYEMEQEITDVSEVTD